MLRLPLSCSSCRVSNRMRPACQPPSIWCIGYPAVASSRLGRALADVAANTDCDHASVLLGDRQRPCRLLPPRGRARRGHRPRSGHPPRLRHRRAADAHRDSPPVGSARAPRDRGLHLPVDDFHAPTTTQMLDALAFLDDARATGTPVAVHCLAGQGRTGTVLAAYLIRGGLSSEQAIADRARHLPRRHRVIAADHRPRRLGSRPAVADLRREVEASRSRELEDDPLRRGVGNEGRTSL